MNRKPKVRRSGEQWRQIIAAQETSGQSVAGYCLEHGLGEKNFYARRRKLKTKTENKLKGFVELASFDQKTPGLLRVTTPGGYQLEVPGKARLEDIRMILKAVASL